MSGAPYLATGTASSFFAKKFNITFYEYFGKFFIPQLENLEPNIMFQLDGAPLHW